jgi:hypothetical protein
MYEPATGSAAPKTATKPAPINKRLNHFFTQHPRAVDSEAATVQRSRVGD